jgi:hypothetical protein
VAIFREVFFQRLCYKDNKANVIISYILICIVGLFLIHKLVH